MKAGCGEPCGIDRSSIREVARREGRRRARGWATGSEATAAGLDQAARTTSRPPWCRGRHADRCEGGRSPPSSCGWCGWSGNLVMCVEERLGSRGRPGRHRGRRVPGVLGIDELRVRWIGHALRAEIGTTVEAHRAPRPRGRTPRRGPPPPPCPAACLGQRARQPRRCAPAAGRNSAMRARSARMGRIAALRASQKSPL